MRGNMKQRRKRQARKMENEIITLTEKLRVECQLCYENGFFCTLNPEIEKCDKQDDFPCYDCEHGQSNCTPAWYCSGRVNPVDVARKRLKGINWC